MVAGLTLFTVGGGNESFHESRVLAKAAFIGLDSSPGINMNTVATTVFVLAIGSKAKGTT